MCRRPAKAARGCSGKIPYATRSQALAAMEGFNRRKGEGEALKSYHCEHCGSFHIGRDPRNRGPEHRARFDKASKAKRYWQLVNGEAL